MIVVRFHGVPGSGKSTAASALLFEMRQAGLRAELAPGFGKVFWEDVDHGGPVSQFMAAVRGCADWVIFDDGREAKAVKLESGDAFFDVLVESAWSGSSGGAGMEKALREELGGPNPALHVARREEGSVRKILDAALLFRARQEGVEIGAAAADGVAGEPARRI